MERTATISDDQRYRYDLTRRWADGPTVLWVMLNPSTADSWSEDPTIRRCIGFSKREGMGGLVVVNLMAFRATRPMDLPPYAVANGPENDATIEKWLGRASLVVAAWGAARMQHRTAAARVTQRLSLAGPVMCLGTTAKGDPRHPLYVRGDQPLELFRPAWQASA